VTKVSVSIVFDFDRSDPSKSSTRLENFKQITVTRQVGS
jgi:hypothetical protein